MQSNILNMRIIRNHLITRWFVVAGLMSTQNTTIRKTKPLACGGPVPFEIDISAGDGYGDLNPVG